MSTMPTNRPGQPGAFGSFGSFLGLPAGVKDRETMLSHKRKSEMQEFAERTADMSQGMSPSERITFNVFSQMGAKLGQKLGGETTLTPEEEQRVSVIEAVNRRTRELKDSDPAAWEAMDPMQRGFEQRRIMTEELGNAGFTEEYLQQAEALYKSQLAYRQGNAQTAKLEGDAELAEKQRPGALLQADADFRMLTEGKPIAAVAVQNGVPVIDGGVINVQAMPDGTYRDAQGQVLTIGTDFMLTNDAININKELVPGGGKPTRARTWTAAKDRYSAKERENFSVRIDNADKMAQVSRGLSEAFVDAGDPRNIVGNPGEINKFLNNTGATLRAAFGAAGRLLDANGDEFTVDGDYMKSIIPDTAVPESIRGDAIESAKYRSNVMQFLYVDARLEEPGARQLSDADIKNAADRLGVNSSDPLSVVKVFGANMDNRYEALIKSFERDSSKLADLGGWAAVDHITGQEGTLEYLRGKREEVRGYMNAAAGIEQRAESSGAAEPGAVVRPVNPDDADLLSRIRNRNNPNPRAVR